MHRTLFTPSMVETFRACKRAFGLAFSHYSSDSGLAPVTTTARRFILKGLAAINKGRLNSVNHVQKFAGQNWPLDKLTRPSPMQERNTRAFIFAYKVLTHYVNQPYKPQGAVVVATALSLRARIAHVRVYIEDVIDLVLWHSEEKRLELVNFQTQPLKRLDPFRPAPSLLFKQYLAERLKIRFPYEKLTLTVCRVGINELETKSIELIDSSTYRMHWQEMVRTLTAMKETPNSDSWACSAADERCCKYCSALTPAAAVDIDDNFAPLIKTA